MSDIVQVLVPLDVEPVAPVLGSVVHDMDGPTMGTCWKVRAVGSRHAPVASWRANVDQMLTEVIDEMSTWEPTSALRRFNDAPAGSWHRLPAGLGRVLATALDLCETSEGAFDARAGALVDAWGFGPHGSFRDAGFRPPAAARVDRLRAVARLPLEFDGAGRHLRQPGGLRLDLSGIAKGYAVDRVAERLRRAGVRAGLVEIGGELSGWGVRPDGQPWWVLLERPDRPQAIWHRVALHGLSVATSGDVRQWFQDPVSGQRRSHTIDPRTGEPADPRVASVSVLASSCMMADGWATALTVLGGEAGFDLARRCDVAALFVIRRPGGGFSERMTPALARLAQ